jgi:hypothetical protein
VTVERDERGNTIIRPGPATVSLRALRDAGSAEPLDVMVDRLRAAGIVVILSRDKQAEYDALKAGKEPGDGQRGL